jgi:linoleate 10R-lipoxygenase
MYKLLMKAFPGWFEYNSVYALYPLCIPKYTVKLLTEQGVMSQYSANPPKKPVQDIFFSTKANVQRILGDQKTFKVVWGEAISRLSGGVDFMLSADKPANTVQRNAVIKAIYTDVPKGMDEVWDFYTKFTEKLLTERSYKLGDFYQVDAAREYYILCLLFSDIVYSTWSTSTLWPNSLTCH